MNAPRTAETTSLPLDFDFTKEARMAFSRKRMSLGLTYLALGRFLGVSWATIRKWEQGETRQCLPRHTMMIRQFLDGEYDKDFQGQRNATNIGAYLKPLPADVTDCVQQFSGCYRLLTDRPDLRKELLDRAFETTGSILRKLVESA